MRILLVEDEPNAAQVLAKGLREQAYAVDLAADGEAAIFQSGTTDYDGLILDVMLPIVDGLTVCRTIRASGCTVPILMLTARDAVESRVEGLDCGADDYLVKPYDRSVLLARMRAVLRRYEIVQPGMRRLEAGDVVLNQSAHTIAAAGCTLPLGAKEFGIAWHLASRPGTTVLRQELLRAVWGIEARIETRSVDMYVSRLRAKLRELGTTRLRIAPVYGIGYRCDVDASGSENTNSAPPPQ